MSLTTVAVDTVFMSDQYQYTGTGKYTRRLLTEFLKIAASDPGSFEFHCFRSRSDKWDINGCGSPFLKIHETRIMDHKRLWLLAGMALHNARIRPDVAFSPTPYASLPNPAVPLVSTIHDAMLNKLPRQILDLGKVAPWWTWIHAKVAKRVITVSAWSRQDLVETYRLDPTKVAVIYCGYNRSLFNQVPPDPQQSDALLSRFGIRRPFILHHGMVHLRKNLDRLIQAWNRVHSLSKEFDAQLVLAGPMGQDHVQIAQARENCSNRDRIILTGPLSDHELALLVKNAFLCVIPSLYEGFCVPLLEAMACGVPTVASKSSCIPEISGGVLQYFDPYSIEEMAEAIRKGLEDSALRQALRQKGVARSAEFSWERCARETLQLFSAIRLEYA